MHEFLYKIGEYLLLLNVAALFISVMAFPVRSAFVPTLLLTVILQSSHMWYEQFLLTDLALKYSKENIRTLWYMGFAFTDFLLIWVAIAYCNITNVVRDKASNIILINVAALGAMQMIRFADRVLIETNLLTYMYKLAIPTLNLSITFIAISYLSYTVSYWVFKLVLNFIKGRE